MNLESIEGYMIGQDIFDLLYIHLVVLEAH